MIPAEFDLLGVLGDHVHHTYDFSSDTATVYHEGREIVQIPGIARDGCRVFSSWSVECWLYEKYGKYLWEVIHNGKLA